MLLQLKMFISVIDSAKVARAGNHAQGIYLYCGVNVYCKQVCGGHQLVKLAGVQMCDCNVCLCDCIWQVSGLAIANVCAEMMVCVLKLYDLVVMLCAIDYKHLEACD